VLAASLDNPEPLVRRHVARALGAVGSPEAVAIMRARLPEEKDESVAAELRDAIARVQE
jgi:HEAT repeat protein